MFSRAARIVGVSVLLTCAATADDKPPLKIGMLSIHTGVAAAIGDQSENGFRFYMKEHGNKLGGYDVDLKVTDTVGTPAIAKSKAQDLVERERVDMVVGPIGSSEALAINDFMREAQMPLISSSALAEDLTQRKPSKWFVRATSATGQLSHALGDYAANTLKYRKIVTIAIDYAYGYEMIGGFQRVFEDNGGQIVQKIWVPLNATDFSSYLSQIGNGDAVYASFSGASAQIFLRQYAEFGYKDRLPLLSSHSLVDESLLPEMGDDAFGIISSGHYSATIQNPANEKFVQGFRAAYKIDPGFYAAGGYMSAMFIDEALKNLKGPVTDKRQLMDALHAVKITSSPRGEIILDEYGNPICDVEIRKVERKDGKLQNTVIKTYSHVSQFWTYEPSKFLANPVYSRDFPPLRAAN
jgi:branched-chain amino acid transport system substrate-binding protein